MAWVVLAMVVAGILSQAASPVLSPRAFFTWIFSHFRIFYAKSKLKLPRNVDTSTSPAAAAEVRLEKT